ncbi:hypothetical protein LASUN_10570 [Lentilactobacillus sunkii]|jgi:uncharacterized paraquat-inducible protein A|uniref:Zinc-ribbon domain-containing protein n=1 Tax=Lentilactobacillus sunkii TaxID=481719 RepID=A0A1E7XEK1_9LACO|nr:zinc ribbon domain-containing protein [Lentilactobacillus sunkii]OFA11448.1 hypothetical protein LASUN_10570 [Lentilactobacillus sunkii]
MNGWIKFGIVWLIFMMMPDYGFIMKIIVGIVIFLILDALFPDNSKKNSESANQVMPSSLTTESKSEQITGGDKHRKLCPSCNTMVDEEANWCPKCGHEFKK